jgi:hypothetical protein
MSERENEGTSVVKQKDIDSSSHKTTLSPSHDKREAFNSTILVQIHFFEIGIKSLILYFSHFFR